MRSGNIIRPGQVLKLGVEGTSQSAPAERNVAAQLHETLEAREQLAIAALQGSSSQQVIVGQSTSLASNQRASGSATSALLQAEFDLSRLKVSRITPSKYSKTKPWGTRGWLGVNSAALPQPEKMSAKASVQTAKD